ncbi:hypothetical protein [Nannocystis punicea]|uniref:Uncharacterized protein n=1 Tax=Nannocystis punicea TaxID=2995304 RepID=A0ABY7H8F9_9BACT|nr:hypothetical protein [Nannocystis poenicansa]WAS95542.1 hypothetical protein O0S08_05215 [Nannocystis poenicansa]
MRFTSARLSLALALTACGDDGGDTATDAATTAPSSRILVPRLLADTIEFHYFQGV